MKVTRKAVFETNSSSTHSISIEGGDYTPDKMPLEGGVCKVHTGEFGWEQDQFHDAATKASYCLTYCKVENGGAIEHEQQLVAVLKAETGCEVKFVSSGNEDYDRWGCIDHQSDGACARAFANAETLRNFIFNPNSMLVTDNDNH